MLDASDRRKPCSTMRTIAQVRPRVEQAHGRLQRIGVGALLDDRRAFAVVLAHDDQRAAHDAGRGEVRKRVGGHVGADDRLPGDRAAQRVVDRCAEHCGGGGLVRAGLDVHAQLVQVGLGLDHHVEQVRHRRALVAADIGHAVLQQRLGDREDAFAIEGRARAQRKDLISLPNEISKKCLLWVRACHAEL